MFSRLELFAMCNVVLRHEDAAFRLPKRMNRTLRDADQVQGGSVTWMLSTSNKAVSPSEVTVFGGYRIHDEAVQINLQ
jgi:hypothetical protein